VQGALLALHEHAHMHLDVKSVFIPACVVWGRVQGGLSQKGSSFLRSLSLSRQILACQGRPKLVKADLGLSRQAQACQCGPRPYQGGTWQVSGQVSEQGFATYEPAHTTCNVRKHVSLCVCTPPQLHMHPPANAQPACLSTGMPATMQGCVSRCLYALGSASFAAPLNACVSVHATSQVCRRVVVRHGSVHTSAHNDASFTHMRACTHTQLNTHTYKLTTCIIHTYTLTQARARAPSLMAAFMGESAQQVRWHITALVHVAKSALPRVPTLCMKMYENIFLLCILHLSTCINIPHSCHQVPQVCPGLWLLFIQA